MLLLDMDPFLQADDQNASHVSKESLCVRVWWGERDDMESISGVMGPSGFMRKFCGSQVFGFHSIWGVWKTVVEDEV